MHPGVEPLVDMTAPLAVTLRLPRVPKRALWNAQYEVLSRD